VEGDEVAFRVDTLLRAREKVRPQLEGLLKDHVVVLDCTSATKPSTIAYYELAQTYMTRARESKSIHVKKYL